jgi:hypothetical protein
MAPVTRSQTRGPALGDKLVELRDDARVLDWDTLAEKHRLQLNFEDKTDEDWDFERDWEYALVNLGRMFLLQLITENLEDIIVDEEGNIDRISSKALPKVFNKVLVPHFQYSEENGWDIAVILEEEV